MNFKIGQEEKGNKTIKNIIKAYKEGTKHKERNYGKRYESR